MISHPFRPGLVSLDEKVPHTNGEEVSIGDTLPSPTNEIAEVLDTISAVQIFNKIAEKGHADLMTALRLMYDAGTTLNAAAKSVKTHYTTLHRQRTVLMQDYKSLVA